MNAPFPARVVKLAVDGVDVLLQFKDPASLLGKPLTG